MEEFQYLKYIIRPVIEDDLLELSKLKKQIWLDTYKNIYPKEKIDNYNIQENIDSFKKILGDENIKFYVVLNNNEYVGYLSYGKPIRPYKDYKYDISLLNISKDHQGKGLGKYLFNFVYEEFKQKGIKQFIVSVNKYNINAHKFYEKMGGIFLEKDKDNIDKSKCQRKYLFNIM